MTKGGSKNYAVVSIPRVDEEEEFEALEDSEMFEVSTKRPSLGQRIGATLSSGFGTGATAFTTVTTAISSALSISPRTTSAVMSVLLALCFATGGLFAYDWFNQPTPALWVGDDDCTERVAEAKTDDTDISSDVGDLERAKIERAKKIYSVLMTYNPNLSKDHIAAVLSNFDAECGIDETSIETIFDEHYQMGPKKKAFDADFYNKSEEALNKYNKADLAVGFYHEPDGKCRVGIGMGSDTGPNCKILRETAESMGYDWYDFDWQLAFIIARGGQEPAGGKKFFESGYFDKQTGSLDELCDYFTKYFEGVDPGYTFSNGVNVGATHRESAQKWRDAIDGWTVDTSYANSVIALIENMGGAAAAKKVEEEKLRCPKCASEDTDVDNSGIAQAAVAMAWPTGEESWNNGTDIYQKVLPAVFNGDTYYKACDRVALSSVRWAGADDDFPSYTVTQIGHMTTSPNWQKVGDSPSEDQLQPGDVMINDAHVYIYTGHEAIEKVHGSKAASSANVVEGSLDDRSAGCVTYGGFGGYTAYRCIKPANSDKYKNVLSGYTFSNGVGQSDNKNCNKKEKDYDNSDLARAFCSLAYSRQVRYDKGTGQYAGSPNYDKVYHAIFYPEDSSWPAGKVHGRSCDRGVATAVRWSGYDDNFNKSCGDPSWGQFYYMTNSPRWEDLGNWDGDESSLQPGDILMRLEAWEGCDHNHICMYVGHDIIMEVYNNVLKGTPADVGTPDSDAAWVSSSYSGGISGGDRGRAPGMGTDGDTKMHVFRCVDPEHSTKYTSILD